MTVLGMVCQSLGGEAAQVLASVQQGRAYGIDGRYCTDGDQCQAGRALDIGVGAVEQVRQALYGFGILHRAASQGSQLYDFRRRGIVELAEKGGCGWIFAQYKRRQRFTP